MGLGVRVLTILLLCAGLSGGSLSGTATAAGCPNEEFRTGPSARLPDCRAYELVTPSDTNGRLLEPLNNITGFGGALWDRFPAELSNPAGSSFVYSTAAGGLLNPSGASGAFDVYRAQRGEGGWLTTERISRSSKTIAWTTPGGVSADHTLAFTNDTSEGLRDYLRKADGTFELVGKGTLADEPYAQGRYIDANGSHVIFTTGKQGNLQSTWCFQRIQALLECRVLKLEPNAPPEGTGAVYDRGADGPTHVVSLLPGDETPLAGQQAFYKGVSKDATSVAFTIEGTLYVRADNGQAGERTEEVAGGDPAFAGLSTEGRYLFYVAGGEKGTIHRFDTTNEADVEVNPVGEGEIVNVSADGSHVYFISEQQLDGVKGTAGQPNMYVWSGASPDFVATVLPSDLVSTSGSGFGAASLTAWTQSASPSEGARGPGFDSSRSTPDGEALIFESRAQLTPYDNADHTEIYRYDDTTNNLLCVSCSPISEPASSDARLQELILVQSPIIVNNLSDDGGRVFFETAEALVARDGNKANDVYEWTAGAEPPLALISSGESPAYPIEAPGALPFIPEPNSLVAITPDGSDVFFTAREALVQGAGENGTQGIFDARVGGGFAGPTPPASPCDEEGCRPASRETSFASSGAQSETTTTNGNVKPRKKRCRPTNKASKLGGRRHCSKHRGKTKRHQKKRAARIASAPAGGGSWSPQDGGVIAPQPPMTGDSSQTATASVSPAPVASVAASAESFGIERFGGSFCESIEGDCKEGPPIAGRHPDFTTVLEFNHTKKGQVEDAVAAVEELQVALPPGLLGNPQATPRCSMGDFLSGGSCPPDSQVGMALVTTGFPAFLNQKVPIFNLTPPHPDQEIIRLGIIAYLPVFIEARVRTDGDYGATAMIHSPPGVGAVIRARATLWGNPSGTEHDKERVKMGEIGKCFPPEFPLGTPCESEYEGQKGVRPSTIPEADRKAFMTVPSACQPMSLSTEVKSYQLPGRLFTAVAPLDPITDCTGLPFAPEFSAEPTSHVAGGLTGLNTKLVIPQHLGGEERATSTMREARVTLPEGMQVAAGAANWIGTCSEDQVGLHKEVDTNCPDASKLGTATITSPALSAPIEGTIYQRSPRPGQQFGLWLTADALGLHIKLPGELEPDKSTGRLTAVFRDLPQVPVSEIDLDVWGGPRAPLQNPDHCGSFATDFAFTPHSNDPPVSGQSQMQITEGCKQPFNPTLKAGVTEPTAGKYSPFVFDLTRPDGDQALRGFTLHLPDGELAKPKGVPLCSDADAAAATCPQGSRIGSLQATTGPGAEPFTLPEPGKAPPQIYFSGPYQGAPFSIVSEVPAQAGPFDLGTIGVRSALQVDPETGQASVKADPLPQFFEGVGIAYRHLHAVIDRPEFNLNPTDCSEMAVTADATSTQGAEAHSSTRFQVDGCKALKFKPKLTLRLKGGTKRAQYPAFSATLKAREGDANLAYASVALPHSEFIAQEHFVTICTRVQFAADNCPKGSIYGKAKAITPLLDKPLSGPVYLRSSNHPLPDLVVKLGGELEIVLVGHVDSVNGGLRTRFETVPDAPVTKFTLQMRGGKKGLFVNSTDICRRTQKASVQMRAQNGRVVQFGAPLHSSGCAKKKLGKPKKHN